MIDKDRVRDPYIRRGVAQGVERGNTARFPLC
jgi:hypothetical protein